MGEDSNHKVDGSLVTADTTYPTVSSVSFADSPGPGDDSTYGAGDWIGVWVTFNESVLVTGAPQMELNIGSATRMAQHGHLAGGRTLDAKVASVANATVVFGYTVQEGDSDTDGISIGTSKLTLNGGAIQDEAGNHAVLTHDAVSDDSGHKVDAPDVAAPTVSSFAITSDPGDDDTYAPGDSVEVTVTFSEDVSGTLQLELDVGGAAKTAAYQSATDSTVVFAYTVASGDSDADGIAVGENKLTTNDATIRDAADNDATLTHDAVAADSSHKVDGVGPTVRLYPSLFHPAAACGLRRHTLRHQRRTVPRRGGGDSARAAARCRGGARTRPFPRRGRENSAGGRDRAAATRARTDPRR